MRRIYRKIRDHEMPTGLKLILGFYLFTTTFSLVNFFQNAPVMFLGQKYSGVAASWISFVFLLIDGVWIVALVRRLKWGWKLFVIYNLLMIPIGFISSNETLMHTGRLGIIIKMAYVGSISLIVITCSYVYQKRHYFSR